MKFPFSNSLPELTREQEVQRKQELEQSGLKVSLSERLVMAGTAFVFLGLPCIAILAVIAFLSMLLFGLL